MFESLRPDQNNESKESRQRKLPALFFGIPLSDGMMTGVAPAKALGISGTCSMIPPTLACATAMRDGGIDAMAALDSAVPAAVSGLSDEEARDIKRMFGEVMAKLVEKMINPSVRAFPELAPDSATWAAVVKERIKLRSHESGSGPAIRHF